MFKLPKASIRYQVLSIKQSLRLRLRGFLRFLSSLDTYPLILYSEKGYAPIALVVLLLFGIAAGTILIQNGVNFLPKAQTPSDVPQIPKNTDSFSIIYSKTKCQQIEYVNAKGKFKTCCFPTPGDFIPNDAYCADNESQLITQQSSRIPPTASELFAAGNTSNDVFPCFGSICKRDQYCRRTTKQCQNYVNTSSCQQPPGVTQLSDPLTNGRFPYLSSITACDGNQRVKYTCEGENEMTLAPVPSEDNKCAPLATTTCTLKSVRRPGETQRQNIVIVGGETSNAFCDTNNHKYKYKCEAQDKPTPIRQSEDKDCAPAQQAQAKEAKCLRTDYLPAKSETCDTGYTLFICSNNTGFKCYRDGVDPEKDSPDCSERKPCLYPEKGDDNKTYCYWGLCEHGQNCATNTLYEDGRCKYISECSINNYSGKKLGTRVACPTGTQNAAPVVVNRPSTQQSAAAASQSTNQRPAAAPAVRPGVEVAECGFDNQGYPIPCYKIGVFSAEELSKIREQVNIASINYGKYKETMSLVSQKIKNRISETEQQNIRAQLVKAEEAAQACLK